MDYLKGEDPDGKGARPGNAADAYYQCLTWLNDQNSLCGMECMKSLV